MLAWQINHYPVTGGGRFTRRRKKRSRLSKKDDKSCMVGMETLRDGGAGKGTGLRDVQAPVESVSGWQCIGV